MAMFALSVFQYPTDSNGLYPGLISDVEFAINDDGSVQVRSALRSMAPDASVCSTWSADGSSAQGESSHESSNKHGANGFEFYDYSPQNERTSPEKERLECGWKTTFLLKLPLF